jgi:hypothetical protein
MTGDAAVEALPGTLAALAARDDVRAALARTYREDRGPRRMVTAMFVLAFAATVGLCLVVHGLLYIVAAGFGVVTLVLGIALAGFLLDATSYEYQLVGVLARLPGPVPEVRLVRVDGSELTAIVTDSVYGGILPGDAGVALLSRSKFHHVMTELARFPPGAAT